MPRHFLRLQLFFFFFLNAQASSFLIHHLCYLRDVMPRQWSPGASHPSPLTSSLTLPWAIARFLDPFYTFSPAHRRVIRDFALPTLLPWVLRIWERVFYCQAFFTLHSLLPRGDKHFKHVPPLKHLIYLSPKELYR